MSAPLDALAREFFSPPGACSSRQHHEGRGSSMTGGMREGESGAPSPVVAAAAPSSDSCTNEATNKSVGRTVMPPLQDDAHFIPPLLQYFNRLAVASAASPRAFPNLAPEAEAAATSTTTATTTTAASQTAPQRHTVYISLGGSDAVLSARRHLRYEKWPPECSGSSGAGRRHSVTHPASSSRAASSRPGGTDAGCLVAERFDVFANYMQPPLSDWGASYESLSRSYQLGLDALVTLVESCNRCMLHERGSAAPNTASPAKRAVFVANAESVSSGATPAMGAAAAAVVAATASEGLGDKRDAIVVRLNSLFRSLIERGERVLALHIIIRVASWRFASKNERVTILFNHLRTCLPTARISTATLAMEAWGQLHSIEASSSVYLKAASELLSLACGFTQYGHSLAEQLTGLVIIRHVALWPTSLYRALLSNERDSLLLATWTSLSNDAFPPRVRELAAATLHALFVIALEQRNFRSVHTVLQHAVMLMLSPENKVEFPSIYSLSTTLRLPHGAHDLPQETIPSTGPSNAAAMRQPSLRPPNTPQAVTRRGDSKNNSIASGHAHPFDQLKAKIFSIGRRVFGGGKSSQRRTSTSALNHSVDAVMSNNDTATAEADTEFCASVSSCFALPAFTSNALGASGPTTSAAGLGHRKLQHRLAQVPPPPNFDTILHAGTLVVGAFVSAVRYCFPYWEPSVTDLAEKHAHPVAAAATATTTASTTTASAAAAAGVSVSAISGEATRGAAVTTSTTAIMPGPITVADSPLRVLSSSRSSCVSSLRSGRRDVSPRRHTGELPLDVEDDASHGTETDESVSGALQRQDDDDDDDDEDNEEDEGEEGSEWCSFYRAGKAGRRPFAMPILLHRSSSRVASASSHLRHTAASATVAAPTPSEVVRPHHHHIPHHPDSEGRHTRTPSLLPSGSRKVAELEHFLTPRMLRKLLALCLSSAAPRESAQLSSWHTERLLPLLALYSPRRLHEEDVKKALRLLLSRSLAVFSDGEATHHQQQRREYGEEMARGGVAAVMYHENDPRALSLINIGLFLSAIATTHPHLFEAMTKQHVYPLLFCALQRDAATYCPAAFSVLALLVHNIPVELRERFQPMVEELTEMAIAAPFTTEMAGVAAKVCAVYKELRLRCRGALLQRIAEVLTESGAVQSQVARSVAGTKDGSDMDKTVTSGAGEINSLDEPAGLARSFFNLEEKKICFRVLQGFCTNWEGTAFFFLDVCTPYMHHRNAALRRECVLACVRLLLSDCFRALPLEAGGLAPADWRIKRVTCNPRRVPLTSTRTSATHATSHVSPMHVQMRAMEVAATAATTTVGNSNMQLPHTAAAAPSLGGDVAVTCDRHTGRSHINTLREVLHRMVEVAVCDPEASIRNVALRNLSTETDQFLGTHAEIVDLLSAALNDEYPPNRVEAVRILRRVAHSVPSVVYPRLRKVLLQTLRDFQERAVLSRPQRGGASNTRATANAESTNIDAEQLKFLFEVIQVVPHSMPLHMDSILQLLQEVLMPHHAAERGTVVVALRMLSYLMDEITREEWHKFEVLLELLSAQLFLRDGDVDRLHAAIGAIQKIIQSVVVTKPFYNTCDLQSIVASSQSLLYQKPSIGSELSLSVLKLLGTISSIESHHQRGDTQGTAVMLGRPEFKYRLPLPLHINTVKLSHQKMQGNRLRAQFTEEMWPDTILCTLLRTFSEALNGILAFTNEELQACLQATVAILRDAGALQNLERYMPALLSVLAGLLERAGADAPLRVSTMENLAELVQLAGRGIAPMYSLLVAFLDQHWVSSRYALSSSCKLLMALCTAVPDLVQEHCVWFLSLLLGKLMQLVGEGAPASPTGSSQPLLGGVSHTARDTAAGTTTTSMVVRDVLKAIHSLLPVADQSTVQSACLALSQLLRNSGSPAGALVPFEANTLQHSTDSFPHFDAEVSRDIAQVLVCLLGACDVTATATTVVESVLLQLCHYAKVHKVALENLAEELQQQQEQRKQRQLLWPRHRVFGNTPESSLNRRALEQELRRQRGSQIQWFNSSSLARLVLENTGEGRPAVVSAFPFEETATSWESPVELDLLACVLLVAGRCRMPAVSYDLMIGEYLEQRFEPSSAVVDFFRCATSLHYRLCLLPVGIQHPQQQQQHQQQQQQQHQQQQQQQQQHQRQQQQQQQRLEQQSPSTPPQQRQERWSASHASGSDIGTTADPLLPSTQVTSGLRSSRPSAPGEDQQPQHPPQSSPIPIRQPRPLHGSRSSSVSSPQFVSSSLPTGPTSVVDSVTQMVVAAACSPETVVSGMRGPSSSLAKRVFCDASSSSPAVVTTTAVGGAAASAVDYASSCKRPPLRPSDALSSNNNSAVNDNEEMMGTAMDEKTSLPAEDDDDVDDGGDETDEQRFFRQHENLSSSEWRPWFEQFCTMLVESSDHVCVSSCSPLVRRHFTIFSSELLPIAFLSHLTKCDDKTVRRWMQLLCDFVRMHNRVPQIIAAELARLAHHIRLYSPSLFSLSLLQAIEDEYITLELVTVLAERALNTPLMLLYLEQQLLCTFTWEALARVVVALEDVNYFNDPRFLSHHPLVRRAAHRMCQASTPGMRRESTSSTKNANSITNNTGVEGANATGEPDFIAGPATRAAACDELLPWEVQRGNDDRGDNNNNNSISASHHSSSSSYALLAAQGTVPSGGGEYRWRPALLESCWFEAASREYLHSIRATLHGPSGDPHGASLTWTKQPLLSPSSVVGAMRCYMRVYDFESILNLWMAIKDAQFVNEETATPSVGEEGCEQQLQRILLGTAWAPSTGPMFSHITRYVVSAAKALSRWNIVDEINFEHVLPTDRSTGECHLRNHRDFPFYNQVEIFRAAALTASKEYGKAKEVLADLRTALKDAYAVFHTENTRLKFELSIMFQQISDLEEGIDAIELKWAMGTGMSEAGATSSSSGGGGLGGGAVVGTAANPAAGGVLPSAEGGKGEGGVQATSVAGGRDGAEAHQGNRSRGAAYTEATRRRLQNIAGRPLPAHSTALQRFETIALRSALVSPDWQLQNILVVCEQIAQEGMPRRAVRTIDHFFSLPIDSSDLRADRQYRDTLLLEKYRLELQHLHRTCELARLQSEITEELMQKCKNYMTGEPGLIHMGEAGEVSFAGFVGTGPISEQHAELLLLHVECERKLSCIHQRRRKLSAAPQPILVPYLDACSGTPSQGVAAGREPFRSPSSSSTAAAASGAIAHNIEEEERPADVLLREYRLMEHIIGSSSIIASIWREFGLLLFDVCMAIYAEWDSTREPETLNNFCVQSEKAISALQKSVQFWSSAAFTSITGIGPFSSTVSRRLRHTRSALPAVHLLLKSLHLALKLEEIDTDGASKDQSEGSGRRTITGHNEEWGRGAGFAQLDFSPAMYVHWGGILPLLVNAAARHIKLHDAVREMCVQSRAMLYQCVFHLVSTFEHRYGSALEHDAGFQGQKLHREESYPGDPHSLSSGPVLVAASSALAPVEELPGDEVTRRAGSRHHTTVAAPTVVATSAGSTSPAQGGPERRQTIEGMQRPKDASRQWRSSMLTNLAEIDAEYKAIVCQTMQLCEFVRSGTEASLTLGMCALPAPTWFLQRHIVAIDGDEAQQQKSKASKTNNSATATDSTKWSEQDHEARTTCNELQRVLHVRRQLNPTSPHYCREEVFLFFLSDGSVLRFHSIEMQENTTTRVVAPSPRTGENRELYRRSSEAFTAPTPVPAPTAVHMTSFTTARINDVTPCGEASNTSLAAAGGDKTAFHTELPDTMPYIRPLAAMESSVCYLLAHLPLQFTRRPLVLPITVQTFITQLPDLPTHSSSWQVTLPPSLQFNYTASMWRQPSSIFHILSDFRLRYREEGNTAPQWHQQPQKQQRMTTDPHDITFMHAASSQTVLSGRELDTVNVASASRSQRIRRRLTEKYERLLEFAFDHGQTRPLCAFLHQVTLSKKLSEVDYPRPSSQLQALQTEIEEVLKRCQRPAEETHAAPERGGRKRATTTSTPDGENEEGFLNEEHSPISAQPRKRRYDASPQQLQESLLTSLRLVILKSEAPRYATALQLAFRGASADAANWLEAVHLYTHELAEWSMLQYLFDTIRREATTFFVDVNSGHVASHHLGVNALQPLPYSARARRMSSSSVGGCGAVSDEPPEKTMSVGPPFPCTDPTAFRLTGCLVSPLPLGCPYGVFLGSATQCLYSVLLYRRDVAGIVKFGLEDMTCFAWRAVTPPHQSPLDGLDAESALKSGSVTILPDSSNREVSRLTAAATGSAGGGSVLLHPFEVSATACAMTTPLGEAPATPAADGAARTSESPCALMDRSGVSSPLRSAQNAVAVPNCAGTSESMEHSPKPERADGEGRLQSASALAAAAAAPAEATSSMRRMSFSAVNTAAFDTWGKRMNPPHRRMNPPRLFDGASIIMKLTDDQLPMRDEPILQPFGQPSMEHSGDLIHIYTSGTNSSVNPGTPFKSTCKTAQSPLKGMGGETAAAAGLSECTSARTVEERVTQLIRVSMDLENLVGTIDVPHRWNLWAPHW